MGDEFEGTAKVLEGIVVLYELVGNSGRSRKNRVNDYIFLSVALRFTMHYDACDIHFLDCSAS